MIRDRGTQKWTAMMLPEHVALLREHRIDQSKTPRPQLDEWDMDNIEETIGSAMKRNVEVNIKTWNDGEFTYRMGTITWIDLKRRTIELEDAFKSFTLPLDEIVDVSILE